MPVRMKLSQSKQADLLFSASLQLERSINENRELCNWIRKLSNKMKSSRINSVYVNLAFPILALTSRIEWLFDAEIERAHPWLMGSLYLKFYDNMLV